MFDLAAIKDLFKTAPNNAIFGCVLYYFLLVILLTKYR